MSEFPSAHGINVDNIGDVTGRVYIKSDSHESEHSQPLHPGQSTHFEYENLLKQGFKPGEHCWMCVDVEGEKNTGGFPSNNGFSMGKENDYVGAYQLLGNKEHPLWMREFM